MSHESLTPAEAERLEMLIEECAEVIQACTKTLRHGWASRHPDVGPDGETNREAVQRELGDVLCALQLLVDRGDLSISQVHGAQARKRLRLPSWTHYQFAQGGQA